MRILFTEHFNAFTTGSLLFTYWYLHEFHHK